MVITVTDDKTTKSIEELVKKRSYRPARQALLERSFISRLLPEVVLLCLSKKSDSNGRAILRWINKTFSGDIPQSIFYPKLHRMVDAGFLIVRLDEYHRNRKIYSLTDKGKDKLSEWEPVCHKFIELMKME